MVADVVAFRPNEFISLCHLGWIVNGVENAESEAVRPWAPAFENHTFQSVPEGSLLKELCEGLGDGKA